MQAQALPYDNLPQLLQVLRETFAGDNESVKRATAILEAMSQDPIRFVDTLSQVITMQRTDEEAMKAKNSASVSMTRCILQLMKQDKLTAEHRNYTIRAVISAMFSEFVALPMKVNLQYFLLLLYTVDVGYEMTNQGLALVKEKFLTQNVHNYPPAFLILQAIINTAHAPQENISNWFEDLREPLISIGGGLARGIMIEAQDISGGARQPEKIASVFVGLKIFKMWVLTLQEFVKLLGQNNIKLNMTASYLKIIVVQENIVQILSAMLMLNVQTDKQIKDCIFSTSGYQEVDQLVNNVKTSILKNLNKVLDLMADISVAVNPVNNKFFLFSRNYGVHTILTSLVLFFRHESLNLDALLNDRDLSELISESLGFLTRMASYQDLQPAYTAVIKHLVIDVCFSLLRTPASEIELFKNHPEQFVALGFDTIGDKSSNTPKTQAAKFLLKLCGSIDGALSYISTITLCIIDYSMVSDKREEIPNTHKDLTDYVNSILIAKTDPTIRVETCLLILTVLTNPITKRKDLVSMIEGLLTAYSTFFLGDESNPLIKARVCMLFSNYSHILFRNDDQQETYALHLRFLLACAGLETQGEGFDALVEQANNSLYSMFEKEFLVATLTPFVQDFLERLTAYILYNKTNKTFDIIHEIVTSYDDILLQKPELILNLIDALVKRWQHEFELTRKEEKAKKMVLNKIWNVIRGIAGKEEYVTKLQNQIETILAPMFAYLEINENLDFDEDILNYVASVTKISKQVSPAIWEAFGKFPKIFERYKGMLSHLFPPLNQIIVHGRDIINQDQNAIQTIINIGIQALNPAHHTADEANYSEGAVLLQLAFQYLEPIETAMFEKMLYACFDKLRDAEQGFLKARLGGVFLCAFLKDFNRTQIALNKINGIKPIMDLFLEDVLAFDTHTYDRKLLIIGLSSLLPHVNISDEISTRYPQIFDITISLLRYVGQMEQKGSRKPVNIFADSDVQEERKATDQNVLKKILKGKEKIDKDIDDVDENDDSDDDDDDDDDDDNEIFFVTGKSEANTVIRNFETALKQEDEFECFKKAVFSMKENKPQMLMALVEALPGKKKEFLKDVLHSKRITTNQDEGKTQARKIVKVGAKKVANIQFKGGNFANL